MKKHHASRLSMCLFVLLMPISSWAQHVESLLIGPGDLLHVQVFETPELDQHVRVTDQGTVPALLIGVIAIGGMTPEGAAHLIEQRLLSGGFLLHPHVTIVVDQFATQNIFVLGQVHTPGVLIAPVPRSVPEVLAQAGGLTDLADTHVTIRRRATGELISYRMANDAAETLSQDAVVYPGDTVLVSRASMVYVLGNVGRPGGYVMNDNHATLTALEALALAGGAPPTASPGHATLVRKTKGGNHGIMISLDGMRKGKIPDLPLQPDDILYIPFSHIKNIAVGLPGILASASSAGIYAVH